MMSHSMDLSSCLRNSRERFLSALLLIAMSAKIRSIIFIVKLLTHISLINYNNELGVAVDRH